MAVYSKWLATVNYDGVDLAVTFPSPGTVVIRDCAIYVFTDDYTQATLYDNNSAWQVGVDCPMEATGVGHWVHEEVRWVVPDGAAVFATSVAVPYLMTLCGYLLS